MALSTCQNATLADWQVYTVKRTVEDPLSPKNDIPVKYLELSSGHGAVLPGCLES